MRVTSRNRLVLVIGGRKLHDEARARALLRGDRDAAAHRGDEALRDEQAHPRAAGPRAGRELREDQPQLLGRDALALVVDPELDAVPGAARCHGDGGARRREANGVVYEVAEDLAELLAVGGRVERLGRELDDEV